MVGSDDKEETSIEIAMNNASKATDLLALFAEFVELPPEVKINLLKLLAQNVVGKYHDGLFKKQLESLSVEEVR